MKHPIQPLEKDEHGVIRFKRNAIVAHLLDNGGIDLNALARLPFSAEDREQFAQLIGYSLSGFGELSYVSDEAYSTATRMAESGDDELVARNAHLREELEAAREGLRGPIARLFGVHPGNLEK